MAALGFENCVMRLPQGWYLYREKYVTRLNLLTSHLLVKVGFMDSNLFRMFEGSNEVSFG